MNEWVRCRAMAALHWTLSKSQAKRPDDCIGIFLTAPANVGINTEEFLNDDEPAERGAFRLGAKADKRMTIAGSDVDNAHG